MQQNRPRPSSLIHSKSFAKTVAPEARFLRLLEANRNNRVSTRGNNTVGKLKLEQRSPKGIDVFRSPPKEENTPTVPLTLADGNRVYIRCSPVRNRSEPKKTIDAGSEKSCALGVSMKELFHRVDGMRRRKIALARRNDEKEITTVNDNHRDDMLWVDKHAPKSFPHLLSDERTNREVLRALRGWDPYVFGKAPPLRPLWQRQREQEREQQNKESGKKELDVKKDANDKRPEENARVILLSGPPGVGE